MFLFGLGSHEYRKTITFSTRQRPTLNKGNNARSVTTGFYIAVQYVVVRLAFCDRF